MLPRPGFIFSPFSPVGTTDSPRSVHTYHPRLQVEDTPLLPMSSQPLLGWEERPLGHTQPRCLEPSDFCSLQWGQPKGTASH